MRKTAYEVRISYWSSDVCSSDLVTGGFMPGREQITVIPVRKTPTIWLVMDHEQFTGMPLFTPKRTCGNMASACRLQHWTGRRRCSTRDEAPESRGTTTQDRPGQKLPRSVRRVRPVVSTTRPDPLARS